jgi:2-isopropylmalate synthase/homocitrate synthase family protein
MKNILIYDTTLRDGAQAEGVSFSLEDKIEILKRFDDFGMHFVEGGLPTSNPKDAEFFQSVSKMKLKTNLTAFGSTRRAEFTAENDPGLKGLAECDAKWICIFGKSWDFHVTDALKVSLEKNLTMVKDSIRFLKKNGKNVIFDAEHFFDGYRDNKEYSLEVLKAAEKAGADWIVLCDTNGGTLPTDISAGVKDAISNVKAPIGIHCHNDSDLAVACSLAAVDSGAAMVQGTINGIGERCGNANLCSIIPNLMLKTKHTVPINDLTKLTALSHFVGETANMRIPLNLPYVGESAFAHKGGMHVSAIKRDSRTYEHVSPGMLWETTDVSSYRKCPEDPASRRR